MGFISNAFGIAIFVVCCCCHPLDDYVYEYDPVYDYEEIARYPSLEHTVYVLNMTSQQWMTPEFSSQPIWWHYITIVIPRVVNIHDMAFHFIGIGQNWHDPPAPDSDPFIPFLANMSVSLGAVMSMISQLPNEPITFADDTEQRARVEDEIIAWTWARYFNDSILNRRPEMMLFFPMTKAVVRAMDAITNFTTEQNSAIDITKYVVGGPSKRGWATWMVGAVDSRVVGMVPMVASCLDIIPNFHHHYHSLGGWSWAFHDYYDEGFTRIIDDPEAVEIAYLQDPYTFIDRFTMPILNIKAGNDEFFALDDTQFYFKDLPGVKYLWLIANSNHIMVGHWREVAANVETFMAAIDHNYQWPEVTWELTANETFATTTVTTQPSMNIINITAYYAETSDGERRDWRWLILGNGTVDDPELNQLRYYSQPVEDIGLWRYRASFAAPPLGWIGFFIEITVKGPGGRELQISTEPNVVPASFAFDDCVGIECEGELV